MSAALAISVLCTHHPEWLPYISGRMLSWTCRDMYETISACVPSFTEIVRRKLSKRLTEEQTARLLARIRECSAVISGSFILACIYDENWYDDVDIYENIPATYMHLNRMHDHDLEKLIKAVMVKTDHLRFDILDDTKIREVMLRIARGEFRDTWERNMGIERILKTHLGFSPISKFLYNQLLHQIDYRDSADLDDHISIHVSRWIRTFTIGPGQQKIQHIPADTRVTRVIARSFDADILKNVYDGTRLHVWDWKLLLAREDVVKPTGLLFAGYTEDDKSPLDIVRERSEKRAEKYTQRGVALTLHPDYDTLYTTLVHAKNESAFFHMHADTWMHT